MRTVHSTYLYGCGPGLMLFMIHGLVHSVSWLVVVHLSLSVTGLQDVSTAKAEAVSSSLSSWSSLPSTVAEDSQTIPPWMEEKMMKKLLNRVQLQRLITEGSGHSNSIPDTGGEEWPPDGALQSVRIVGISPSLAAALRDLYNKSRNVANSILATIDLFVKQNGQVIAMETTFQRLESLSTEEVAALLRLPVTSAASRFSSQQQTILGPWLSTVHTIPVQTMLSSLLPSSSPSSGSSPAASPTVTSKMHYLVDDHKTLMSASFTTQIFSGLAKEFSDSITDSVPSMKHTIDSSGYYLDFHYLQTSFSTASFEATGSAKDVTSMWDDSHKTIASVDHSGTYTSGLLSETRLQPLQTSSPSVALDVSSAVFETITAELQATPTLTLNHAQKLSSNLLSHTQTVSNNFSEYTVSSIELSIKHSNLPVPLASPSGHSDSLSVILISSSGSWVESVISSHPLTSFDSLEHFSSTLTSDKPTESSTPYLSSGFLSADELTSVTVMSVSKDHLEESSISASASLDIFATMISSDSQSEPLSPSVISVSTTVHNSMFEGQLSSLHKHFSSKESPSLFPQFSLVITPTTTLSFFTHLPSSSTSLSKEMLPLSSLQTLLSKSSSMTSDELLKPFVSSETKIEPSSLTILNNSDIFHTSVVHYGDETSTPVVSNIHQVSTSSAEYSQRTMDSSVNHSMSDKITLETSSVYISAGSLSEIPLNTLVFGSSNIVSSHVWHLTSSISSGRTSTRSIQPTSTSVSVVIASKTTSPSPTSFLRISIQVHPGVNVRSPQFVQSMKTALIQMYLAAMAKIRAAKTVRRRKRETEHQVQAQVLGIVRAGGENSKVSLDFTVAQNGHSVPADDALTTLNNLTTRQMSDIIKYPVLELSKEKLALNGTLKVGDPTDPDLVIITTGVLVVATRRSSSSASSSSSSSSFTGVFSSSLAPSMTDMIPTQSPSLSVSLPFESPSFSMAMSSALSLLPTDSLETSLVESAMSSSQTHTSDMSSLAPSKVITTNLVSSETVVSDSVLVTSPVSESDMILSTRITTTEASSVVTPSSTEILVSSLSSSLQLESSQSATISEVISSPTLTVTPPLTSDVKLTTANDDPSQTTLTTPVFSASISPTQSSPSLTSSSMITTTTISPSPPSTSTVPPSSVTPSLDELREFLLMVDIELRLEQDETGPQFKETFQKGIIEAYSRALQIRRKRDVPKLDLIIQVPRPNRYIRQAGPQVDAQVTHVERKSSAPPITNVTFYISEDGNPVPATTAAVTLSKVSPNALSAYVAYPVLSQPRAVHNHVAATKPFDEGKSSLFVVAIVLPSVLVLLLVFVLVAILVRSCRQPRKVPRSEDVVPTKYQRGETLDDYNLHVDVARGEIVDHTPQQTPDLANSKQLASQGRYHSHTSLSSLRPGKEAEQHSRGDDRIDHWLKTDRKRQQQYRRPSVNSVDSSANTDSFHNSRQEAMSEQHSIHFEAGHIEVSAESYQNKYLEELNVPESSIDIEECPPWMSRKRREHLPVGDKKSLEDKDLYTPVSPTDRKRPQAKPRSFKATAVHDLSIGRPVRSPTPDYNTQSTVVSVVGGSLRRSTDRALSCGHEQKLPSKRTHTQHTDASDEFTMILPTLHSAQSSRESLEKLHLGRGSVDDPTASDGHKPSRPSRDRKREQETVRGRARASISIESGSRRSSPAGTTDSDDRTILKSMVRLSDGSGPVRQYSEDGTPSLCTTQTQTTLSSSSINTIGQDKEEARKVKTKSVAVGPSGINRKTQTSGTLEGRDGHRARQKGSKRGGVHVRAIPPTALSSSGSDLNADGSLEEEEESENKDFVKPSKHSQRQRQTKHIQRQPETASDPVSNERLRQAELLDTAVARQQLLLQQQQQVLAYLQQQEFHQRTRNAAPVDITPEIKQQQQEFHQRPRNSAPVDVTPDIKQQQQEKQRSASERQTLHALLNEACLLAPPSTPDIPQSAGPVMTQPVLNTQGLHLPVTAIPSSVSSALPAPGAPGSLNGLRQEELMQAVRQGLQQFQRD